VVGGSLADLISSFCPHRPENKCAVFYALWRNDVKETEKDIGRGTQKLRNQKRQEEEQVSFLLLLLFIGFHQTCTHVQHMAVCLVTIGSSSSTWGGFYFILFFRGMKEIRNQRTPPV
jgi:hypothetical protein